MMVRIFIAMSFAYALLSMQADAQEVPSIAVDKALPPSLPAPGGTPAVTTPTNVPTVPVVRPGAPNPPPVTPSFAAEESIPVTTAKKPDLTLGELQKMIANPPTIQSEIAKIPDMKTLTKDIKRRMAPVDPTKFNGDNFDKLPWTDSLMFPESQLRALYDVMGGNLSGAVNDQVAVQVKLPRVAPTFYVNSVLYEGPKNWTIWLNSRRVRAGASFPDLEIASVDDDRVEFLWKTDQLDYISPEWDEKIRAVAVAAGEPIPKWAYESPDRNIAVDQTRRIVRFVLGPHQSFITRKMQIVEGYQKSVFFKTGVPGQQGVQPGQANQPGAQRQPALMPGALPPVSITGRPTMGPGLSRMGVPSPQPVIPGGIPGAAPGSPMGAALPAQTTPSTSLNPMAPPAVMLSPPGSVPLPTTP